MNAIQPREVISDSIDINAAPEAVWALVSDLRRMGEWSPQCRRMFITGGEVKAGTRTVNINSQGLLVWPTRARVTVFDAPRKLEFKIAENGTYWVYELVDLGNGRTQLTESRRAPGGVTKLSEILQKLFLGGVSNFEDRLQSGIASTLQRIKREVEAV